MMFRNFAIVSLLAMLLLFGCAQKSAPAVQETVKEPAQVAPVSQEPCKGGNVVQNDECFLSLAKQKSDAAICVNIYSVDKLDACYASFANADVEICKKITNAGMRAGCLTENAKREKSASMCELIGDEALRFACLKEVMPPCSSALMPDENERAACLAFEKKDYTLCTNDACFLKYAIGMESTDACGRISVQSDRFYCLAMVKNSTSECANAGLAPVRSACAEKAAEMLDDMGGCTVAETGSDYQNRCYLHFAVERSDSSICQKVEPEFSVGVGTSRYWCYAEYAAEKADISVCPKIGETLNRISCYYQAAKRNRMPSLCNLVGRENQMSDCYAGSILYLDSGPLPSDCASVASLTWKNKCYYISAKATDDKSLCALIGEGPDKSSCDLLFGTG